jgi:hypothetical protein
VWAKTKPSPIGRIWRRPRGRHGRLNLVRPPAETGVEIRSLAAYDTALGIVGAEGQMA